MAEIRGTFKVRNREYSLHIEKGIVKVKGIYLSEVTEHSKFSTPVPVKFSASTLKEDIEFWLNDLKLYVIRLRCKKCAKPTIKNADANDNELEWCCTAHWMNCLYRDFLEQRTAGEQIPCQTCERHEDCKSCPPVNFLSLMKKSGMKISSQTIKIK